MIYKDITKEQLTALVTETVLRVIGEAPDMVPVGISVKHVHLSQADLYRLFGFGYALTPKKELSQPGQYAAEECVDIIGPKGELKKVRILGPVRSETQIELAQTDCRMIGIKAPVRSSGDLEGTPGAVLRGPMGEITLEKGVIIADRHIHLSPDEAERFGLRDGDHVSVEITGIKPGIMGNVLIRSNSGCRMDMHIDTDDGNAFMLSQGQRVKIVRKED